MERISLSKLRSVIPGFLAWLALGVTGWAQTTTFTYQGSLTVGGTVASGSYDLQFKLYDQPTGGALQGSPSTVTVPGVTATGGVFTVDLNFGADAFPGAARYLEISVRPAGSGSYTTLAPRQQLTSTPYAIRSLSAASADTATSATTATTATNFSGSLAGDVTGTQSATTVALVGGVTASNVASGATAANNATSNNTANTIVKRDAAGNFSAGTITATLNGNASTATSATTATTATNATNFTGSLSGDVTGTQSATVVSTVGGTTASNIASGATAANNATNVNTANSIIKRDASGNFSAGTITASLNGNASSATTAATATNFTGSLAGDVSGTQAATVVSSVGGVSASNVANGATAANNATDANTANAIVKRDASGNFSAGAITASLNGNASTATSATNFSGSLAGDVTGTQAATVVSAVGGTSASSVASGAMLANNATDTNMPSTIVKRDASGNFSAGTITASGFSGGGANLTNLNASNIGSGTLLDSLLSSNVAKLNTAQTFTANQTFSANLFQSGALVQFTPTNGFVVSGTMGSGSIPATGVGARMMWYPNKAAFRAGEVTVYNTTQWDDANIGISSVGLGQDPLASGAKSIALGAGAQATNDDAIALGPSSRAQGVASVAIGPCTASGEFATCIGLQTQATGQYSVTIGRQVRSSADYNNTIVHKGVIAIGDASPGFSNEDMYATADNQFNVRAVGGIRFFTACCAYDTGVTVSAGGGAWNSISDRNLKENFKPVSPREILRGVLGLPISTWNYKAQDKAIRHIGAMAQDFFAAFKVGEDDKHIATIDPDGVALAAIQGLHEELQDRDAKIEQQQQQLGRLEQQAKEQQARAGLLEQQVKQQQAMIDCLRKLLCTQNPQAEVCKKQ